MKFNLFMESVLVVMLSMAVSKIVYFGFTPNYEADIFSHRAFDSQFDHGGYQYRVLSRYIVYAVDELLGGSINEEGAENRIGVVSFMASERLYFAIYYVNTFFLALTSLIVVLLLNLDRRLRFSGMEKMLLVFLVPMLIGLTQFAVHYYDLSSYFLELLTLYVFLKNIDRRYILTLAIIAGLIALSTLNRESAEVSVALVVMLLLTRFGVTRRVVWSIVGMVAFWLMTYYLLKLEIGPEPPPNWSGNAGIDFDHETFILGVIFWMLFIYLPFALTATKANKYLIGGFFLLSLPYIVGCLATGDLWAVRLYMPLFLGALFLSRLKVEGAISRRRPVITGRLSRGTGVNVRFLF